MMPKMPTLIFMLFFEPRMMMLGSRLFLVTLSIERTNVWYLGSEISKTVFRIFLAQILRKLCAKLGKCELDALFSHVSSDGRSDGRWDGKTES